MKNLLSPGFWAIYCFRFATYLYHSSRFFYPISKIILILSRIVTGIEIELGAKIGNNFRIAHGVGIVIGNKVSIGNNVKILQGVTLGGSFGKTSVHEEKIIEQPVLEDDILIGAGAVIIGPIVIKSHSIVGANSVVTKNFDEYSLIVGNPAKLLKKIENDEYKF